MSIVSRLAGIFRGSESAVEGGTESGDGALVASDPRSPEERAYVEQFSNESEVERLRRQRDEYFAIIERIERERDGLWRLYRQSVSEHLNAQHLLERHLAGARVQVGRAVTMLNELRKQSGKEPIEVKGLGPYEGEPIGTAKQYAEEMIELCKRFPEMLDGAKPELVDGKQERDDVAASQD